MVTFRCHMEYSMWSLFPAVWSASYCCHTCQFWKKWKELRKTCFQCSMEYSIWPWITAIWSTPYGTSLVPYGVLYNKLLMKITKVVWCTPYGYFFAIWSTPCGHCFLPYGVLHINTIHVNFGRNAKSSIRLVFNALWRTPYGIIKQLYGVLHMTIEFDLCGES